MFLHSHIVLRDACVFAHIWYVSVHLLSIVFMPMLIHVFSRVCVCVCLVIFECFSLWYVYVRLPWNIFLVVVFMVTVMVIYV